MALRNRARGRTRKAGRGRRGPGRKFRLVRRRLLSNQPTFVETFQLARDNMAVPQGDGSGLGKYFKVRITDIPQVAQYANLYTQYRINWVKVMLLPQYNTQASDANASSYNMGNTLNSYGMARIVYAIQDSPDQTDPTTENEVLEDNGCKIKPMGAKWSCSFKPVPDITIADGASGVIPIRMKNKSWFNFDTATPANNPYHGGVKAWITLPGLKVGETGQPITWYAYYKVSFSLRDPQ